MTLPFKQRPLSCRYGADVLWGKQVCAQCPPRRDYTSRHANTKPKLTQNPPQKKLLQKKKKTMAKTISHCPEIPGGWKSSSSCPLSLKAAIRSSSNKDVQASVAATASPLWTGRRRRRTSQFFPLSFQLNHQHGMLNTHIRSHAFHIDYKAGFVMKARQQPCRREKQTILCNSLGWGGELC